MRLLIISNLYSPEPSGVGPYSAGLAKWLVQKGHTVDVVCATPSYPHWKRFSGHGAWSWTRRVENGVTVHRCPVYVPARVGGVTRMAHYASFAAAAAFPIAKIAVAVHPHVVMHVAPTMLAAPLALGAARGAGASSWVHIQDFEVGAALGTGQLSRGSLIAQAAQRFENGCIRRFDMASSISPAMCRMLAAIRGTSDRVYEFRNWADLDQVQFQTASAYRTEWNVERPHVALYSGSIAKKQGIDLVIDAARTLSGRRDIQFVICGDGPNQPDLEASAADLDNVMFQSLQPKERLGDLLALADVHLLPQKADVADQVLPSKLTNMLASGRPVIATAAVGTGLSLEVEGCGILTPPGDVQAFADAIADLIDHGTERARLGMAGRLRAEERWGRDEILGRLERELVALARAARGRTAFR